MILVRHFKSCEERHFSREGGGIVARFGERGPFPQGEAVESLFRVTALPLPPQTQERNLGPISVPLMWSVCHLYNGMLPGDTCMRGKTEVK